MTKPGATHEQYLLAQAYDDVVVQPYGPADNPQVHIQPQNIAGAMIARGGYKGMGDPTVRGSGWGLAKIIWRHGEKSSKAQNAQVTLDDVLAFPRVIRDFVPTRDAIPGGQGREWRVSLPGADGTARTVVYADNTLAGRGDTPHLVSIYVQEAIKPGHETPLSVRRAFAGTPGSTDGSLEPPSGYRRGPFDQSPQGQECRHGGT